MKILLFEAIWCKECKLMHTLWRNLKLEMPELELHHRDIDEFKEIFSFFGILDVPTAVICDNEENILERIVGIQHRDTVLDIINKYKNL